MKTHKLLVAALAATIAAGTAHAGFVDFSLNSDTVDVAGAADLGSDENVQFLIGGRYLYSDDNASDASIPAVLAAFTGRPSASEAIDFYLGFEGLFGEALDEDVFGVALGGAATYAPPAWKGAFAGVRLFYAPGVLCFGNTDGVLEWSAGGGYEITPNIRVFVEYSEMTVDIEDSPDIDVRDGATAGLGIRF